MTQLETRYQTVVPNALREIAESLDTRTLAAIMCLQAMLNGKSYYPGAQIAARDAVAYADALVEALNKKKKSYE